MLNAVLVYVWSLLISLLLLMVKLASLFSPQLRKHLLARQIDRQLPLLQQELQRSPQRKNAVVFCSSAGEYEQAVPLLDKLVTAGSYNVIVVFFSLSGITFIKARGDTYPYILAPFDTLGQWQKFFAHVRPELSIVVRHELWPAFLYCARRVSRQVLLINASRSSDNAGPPLLSRLSKSWLLGFFHRIYCVAEADCDYFKRWFKVPSSLLAVSGDSKYDRVLLKSPRDKQLLAQFRGLFEKFCPHHPRIIVGSAWPKDYELVLDGLLALPQSVQATLCCIIALHEPTAEHLAELETACKQRSITSIRFSYLQERFAAGDKLALAGLTVVLVDSLGILSALYGCCHVAVVGGALHHKVHNVLEPASYGLTIAHGPFFRNSVEAIALRDAGLTSVVTTPAEFATWSHAALTGERSQGEQVRQFLESRAGAANKLFASLSAH